MKRAAAWFAALALLALPACTRGPQPLTGEWRAALQLPGGELPFGLSFSESEGRITATLLNGEERIALPETTRTGDTLKLLMPGFQHRIDARIAGDAIRGEVRLVKRRGEIQVIPMTAQRGTERSFFPAASLTAKPAEVGGRWAVQFKDADGSVEDAVGEFRQQGTAVNGTFLTGTGDHRFISGQVKGDELYLGKFDGAQAYLYRAKVQADGQLAGDYWSGMTGHALLTAHRDESANTDAAERATLLKSQDERFDFTFPDLKGRQVSLHDADFLGKVVVVTLAGSWCPNCHDEAGFLAPYYKAHRAQGLEVISLMFEQFDEYAQAVDAIARFQQKFAIDYTVLVAGVRDTDDASKKLPQLNRVIAYPTTIFIDRKGKVRLIHTGFAGPATGEHYEKIKTSFDGIIQGLLAEKG